MRRGLFSNASDGVTIAVSRFVHSVVASRSTRSRDHRECISKNSRSRVPKRGFAQLRALRPQPTPEPKVNKPLSNLTMNRFLELAEQFEPDGAEHEAEIAFAPNSACKRPMACREGLQGQDCRVLLRYKL